MNLSRRIFLICVLSLTVSTTAFAQTANLPSLDQQKAAITEVDINGLKVLVKRRPGAPTVAVSLFVRGGVLNLTSETAGLENLTLLTSLEASSKFPREKMRKELARLGSSLGSSSSLDYSVISLASTKDSFSRTWEIFTDAILNPAFSDTDLNLVRERMVTALKNRTVSPDSNLDFLTEKVVHANHPYSIDPFGTLETVGSVTTSDLRAYHSKILQSSRLLLVAVGDIEPNEFAERVRSAFGNLPKGTYIAQKVPPLAFTKPTLEVTPKAVETNYVKGVFAAPAVGDPDYYAMRVAVTILQTKVYEEIRLKRNLSYAPNAEMDDFAANTGNIYVTTNDANQSVYLMLQEIEKLKNEDLDEQEFLTIPGFFLSTYFLKLETNVAQANELGRYELVGGGWRRSADFIRGIGAVTPSDVRRVAQKYLKNLKFIVLGDPNSINRSVFLNQ